MSCLARRVTRGHTEQKKGLDSGVKTEVKIRFASKLNIHRSDGDSQVADSPAVGGHDRDQEPQEPPKITPFYPQRVLHLKPPRRFVSSTWLDLDSTSASEQLLESNRRRPGVISGRFIRWIRALCKNHSISALVMVCFLSSNGLSKCLCRPRFLMFPPPGGHRGR